MLYLRTYTFPTEDSEFDYLLEVKRKCYNTFYPFKILSKHYFERIDFETITILYGGNGSGKSTALNVIAEKIGIQRDSLFHKSTFFDDYVEMCEMELAAGIPQNSKIITSDDVFDYMLNVRSLNVGINQRREELFAEYLDAKYADFQMQSLEDYEELKRINAARSKTQSSFVRSELMANVREFSNGESAFKYFTEKIEENGLYLLDEPENSLSPQRQIELAAFIQDTAAYFNCQFIISTHSPFLLALQGAKICDLDEKPVTVKRWTELDNIRAYFDFFKQHEGDFY